MRKVRSRKRARPFGCGQRSGIVKSEGTLCQTIATKAMRINAISQHECGTIWLSNFISTRKDLRQQRLVFLETRILHRDSHFNQSQAISQKISSFLRLRPLDQGPENISARLQSERHQNFRPSFSSFRRSAFKALGTYVERERKMVT